MNSKIHPHCEAQIKAFNEGCDARLAGKVLDANPYSSSDERNLYWSWRHGWLDVNNYWGVEADRVKALPKPIQ